MGSPETRSDSVSGTARAGWSGDEEKDRAIICPRIYHRDEIERDGHCHCRLYYQKDATRFGNGWTGVIAPARHIDINRKHRAV